MKNIDHKIINDLYRKEIQRLNDEVYKNDIYTIDKSQKRETKRKQIQTQKSYDRFKAINIKKKKKK